MKKLIKHYPMTDRLIVRRGYIYEEDSALCILLLLDFRYSISNMSDKFLSVNVESFSLIFLSGIFYSNVDLFFIIEYCVLCQNINLYLCNRLSICKSNWLKSVPRIYFFFIWNFIYFDKHIIIIYLFFNVPHDFCYNLGINIRF